MPEESPHPLEVWPIQEVLARMTLGVSFTFFAVRINATTEVTEDSIRSEEHTSELQSLLRISYAVFCLQKKKRISYTVFSLKTAITTFSIIFLILAVLKSIINTYNTIL